LVACPTSTDGPPEFQFESQTVLLDLSVAAPTGNETQIPEDLAGVIHSGISPFHDEEYYLLNEMSARWVHRDFSWWYVQRDVPADHERFEDWDWLKNENWNFDWLDDYVRRANKEGKLVMAMLLYDTPWIHRKYPRDDRPGNADGSQGRRREVRMEQIVYFVNYSVRTVERFSGKPGSQGRVDSWFIWNEPCLQPRFWTWEQEDFLEMTLQTARAIRPLTDAYIIGGVFSVHALADLSGWVGGLFENGAYRYLDGLAFHPYGPGHNGTLTFFNRFKDYVREKDAIFGTDFADNIWVNEVGFPTYGAGTGAGWEGIPPQREEDRSEAVAKTFALLAANGVRNIMWFNMFDSRADREGFGLLWRRCAPGTLGKKRRVLGLRVAGQVSSWQHLQGNELFPGRQRPRTVPGAILCRR